MLYGLSSHSLHHPTHRSPILVASGTIKIEAADETDGVMYLTFFGSKKVFKQLRELWNQSKLTTVVD